MLLIIENYYKTSVKDSQPFRNDNKTVEEKFKNCSLIH